MSDEEIEIPEHEDASEVENEATLEEGPEEPDEKADFGPDDGPLSLDQAAARIERILAADAGINWQEGMPPSAVNTSARGMMTAVKSWWGQSLGGINHYTADTGAADAYAIAPTPAISAYAAGQVFSFFAGNANAGAATLVVNGLATKAIQINGIDLVAGDITASMLVSVVYDGTQFQMLIAKKGLASLVDDTTPQLGGMLDVNGKSLGDGTSELIRFTEAGNSISYLASSAASVATSTTPGSGAITPTYDALTTGENRCLVVVVSALRTTSSSFATVSSATYDGVSMTVEQTASYSTAADQPDVSILTLKAPATGSNTLSITFDAGWDSYVVLAAVYTGTDQTTPVDVKDADTALATTFSSLTVTTTGANRHIVVGAAYQNGTVTFAPEGAGAERIEAASGGSATDDCGAALVDYAAATAQAYSDDVTATSSQCLAGAMIALKPALAVNELTVKNAATGSSPQLQATGDDANVNLLLSPKGSGVVKSGNNEVLTDLSALATIDGDAFDTSADKVMIYDASAGAHKGTLLNSFGMTIVNSDAAQTFALADGNSLQCNTGTVARTWSLPTNASVAFAIGTVIGLAQTGTGEVTIDEVTPATTTLLAPGGNDFTLDGQGAMASLVKVATDTWILTGKLKT